MSDNANAQNQNSDQPAIDIVRIYAKDCSRRIYKRVEA